MSKHLEASSQITTLIPVPVPGTDNRLMAVERDGEVWVSPNHICMALNIDWKSQNRKLNSKPWASMVKMTMELGGQNRELVMIDRSTLTMWLATIDASRIKSDYARSILEAYQVEAADALDSYFHEGAAINPRTTPSPELPDRRELAQWVIDAEERIEALETENTAYKGGDGIRIKDFIKTYFVAPNERRIFEWFYFHGLLIDGRMRDTDGRASRSGKGPKLRWDHMHPTFIGRQFFKLVTNPEHANGRRLTRIIPERALDLVGLLLRAPDLNVQMTAEGRRAADEVFYVNPNQLRLISGE